MQEERSGDEAPVRLEAGGERHSAEGGMGALRGGGLRVPEIVHHRPKHGVA
jgi:hypothetical protein